MTSHRSESDFDGTPPDILEKAMYATSSLIPSKSQEKYESVYQKFMDWHSKSAANSFSENVLLAYFATLSETYKPSSLWSIYSMLKSTLNIKNDIDISTYPKLKAFLKRRSSGYKAKKAKILTADQINKFIVNAPNEEYLFLKVSHYSLLIF